MQQQVRSPQAATPTEIVVKIVREVVHVTSIGSVYNANPSAGSSDELGTSELEEKIAEAAVSSMQNGENSNHNAELARLLC